MNTLYSSDYSPPAPVIPVSFNAPAETSVHGPFQALIDTGADMSVAPRNLLIDVGAPSLFEAQLSSQWGEQHSIVIYLVDVQIGNLRLPGVQVAGDEITEEIILGRNILNKLPLFLDGPKQVAELLSDPATQRLRTAREAG